MMNLGSIEWSIQFDKLKIVYHSAAFLFRNHISEASNRNTAKENDKFLWIKYVFFLNLNKSELLILSVFHETARFNALSLAIRR